MQPNFPPTTTLTRDLQAVSNEAWDEFAATAPEGIDLVAEASLRRLMATRIRRAAAMGEVDRRALRASALVGL
jgi:hypothetical protein